MARTSGWLTDLFSTTDPDATIMPPKGDGHHVGYHTHCVVDGGKARIILAALVTPSEVMENQPVLDLRLACAFSVETVAASNDGRHDLWNHRQYRGACPRAHPRLCALADFDHRTPFYGQREFQYDPQQDVSTCPQAARLRLKKHRYTERTKVYRADAAPCNACPLKKHCTESQRESQRGRSLKRSFDEESLEQVRTIHATEPYQKAMRTRSVWVEPLFA